MDPIDRMLIEHECQKLILHYTHLMDCGEWESLAATFTEDAIFARPSSPDDVIHGRDNILASFTARPAGITEHVVTNIMVTVISDTEAAARSTVLLFPGKAEPGDKVASHARDMPVVGHFVDRLRLENDRWLFSTRRGYLTIK